VNRLERENSRLNLELATLKLELQQANREKQAATAQTDQLRKSIEQLEERQRYIPQGTCGASQRDRSVRSASSRGSSRFRTTLKGNNCMMTFDGMTATRTKGCRQCVVLGDAPLEHHAGVGWYFELMVNEVVSGWVGGLGVGVTTARPSNITQLPDRAWRVPNSWIAGYWGRMFANGQQHLIEWRPQDLKVNEKVGFLVTLSGECIVYVNGEVKVHFNEVPVPISGADAELIALVDVFASTASVSLIEAIPPQVLENAGSGELPTFGNPLGRASPRSSIPKSPRVGLLNLQ